MILEMFDSVRNLSGSAAAKAKFCLERDWVNGSLPLRVDRPEHWLAYEQVLRVLWERAVTTPSTSSAPIALKNRRGASRVPSSLAFAMSESKKASCLARCLRAWALVRPTSGALMVPSVE